MLKELITLRVNPNNEQIIELLDWWNLWVFLNCCISISDSGFGQVCFQELSRSQWLVVASDCPANQRWWRPSCSSIIYQTRLAMHTKFNVWRLQQRTLLQLLLHLDIVTHLLSDSFLESHMLYNHCSLVLHLCIFFFFSCHSIIVCFFLCYLCYHRTIVQVNVRITHISTTSDS